MQFQTIYDVTITYNNLLQYFSFLTIYLMVSTASNKPLIMFIESTYLHSSVGTWFFPAIWSTDL